MEDIAQIVPVVQGEKKHFGLVCHQKPDADALGSMLGLLHYLEAKGHQVTAVSPTNWANYFEWMPGMSKVFDYDAQGEAVRTALAGADYIVCLDFNHLSRTRNMAGFLNTVEAPKILIDHHQEPDVQHFAYGISDTTKSSTAEMVYDFIVLNGDKELLDENMASCLYSGVMTDTGSFRYPSTTGSAHAMVAQLKTTGFEHFKVHDALFDNFLENRLRFLGHVLLHRMEVLYEYNTVLLTVPRQDIVKFDIGTGDTEGLVNLPFSIKGIRMVAIVIDRVEERKWSFRSKGDVDVSEFARKYFNGGGHKNAAGGASAASYEATIKDFFEALKTMRNELCEPNLYDDVT